MDYYIFQLFNNLAGQWICLDSLAIFFADAFKYIIVFALLLFLFKWQKNRAMVFWSLIAAIIARLGICQIIRFFYYRPRPYFSHEVFKLLDKGNEGSFPSGHTSFFFALSTVVYFYNKKAGILFFVASFLMGISRIFIGVHYPLDILAGIIIGIFSGWLVYKYLAKRTEKKKIARKESLAKARRARTKKKEENKKKILAYLKEQGKIRNDEVEKLINVSDAMATNYLAELEKEGLIEQVGKTGWKTFYHLKS